MDIAATTEALMARARVAAGVFGQLDQAQVDRILEAVYRAGFDARVPLAKQAAEETGMGRWQHKVIKNVVATQFVWDDIRHLPTVGVIREDEERGIVEIAQPLGPILAVIPATNPTSTTLFKILSALKTRNPLIVSPARRALQCTVAAAALQSHGAVLLDPAQARQLEAVLFPDGERVHPELVGKPARVIAQQAGLAVPDGTELLVVEPEGVGEAHPLSREILAPVLALYAVEGYEAAINTCLDLNFFGGIGHTVSLFCNDEARIREFAALMTAGRIVVNMPSSQGAVGRIYNALHPSFTLGCGTGGKNITTDNVTARHLINVQRVARRREDRALAQFDNNLYLDPALDSHAIEALFHRNR